MNTNPDEARLALWLDDELAGDELAIMEAWATSQPAQLAAREETRRWRATMAAAMPASEEPPFPDFFNSRVLQSIREELPQPVAAQPRKSVWNAWLMPAAACAGMAFAFLAGKNTRPETAVATVVEAPKASVPTLKPAIYTPEQGVKAEWFSSVEASATVIVLEGVSAFPDSMDFSETAYLPTRNGINLTAGGPSEIVFRPK